MAPKKAEDKSKDKLGATSVSIEDFIRTRDVMMTGLSTMQTALSELSRSYITHTNAILGKGASVAFDPLAFANPIGGDNGIFAGARIPTPAPPVEQPAEGKKRKRAPHDKNAPKRALTPFFLYLQSQRTTIGKELGDKFTAKEIQDEGGRRWREMPDKEKAKWQEEYGVNFARYQEHMKAYKAGLPLPDISDAEAKKLYEKNIKDKPTKSSKASGAAAATPAADAAADDDDEEDSSSDEEDSAKEPTPPPAKKSKSGKETKRKSTRGEEATTPAAADKASPARKRKSAKKDKESTPAKAAEEPKSKKKGRKHKSGEVEA